MRSVVGATFAALAVSVTVAGPAHAAGENGGAFGLRATGVLDVAALPDAQCPGNPNPPSVAAADLNPTLNITAGVLNAGCSAPGGAGSVVSSSASVATANVGLGGVLPTPILSLGGLIGPVLNIAGLNLNLLNGISLTAVSSECTTSASGAATGSSVLTLNGTVVTAPTTATVNLGPAKILEVALNEQTTAGGFLVVNAVRLSLLESTGLAQEVILAQSRCRQGGVIPEVPLAIILPLSAAGLFGVSYLVMRRRPAGAAPAA
ncbi:MAG: hypothetical protein ACRD0F_00795 [Acidimicrobiales bacterium]